METFFRLWDPGQLWSTPKHPSKIFTKEESELVDMRQRIFHLLKGTPLNVVVLNNSNFITLNRRIFVSFTADNSLKSQATYSPLASFTSIPEYSTNKPCIIKVYWIQHVL